MRWDGVEVGSGHENWFINLGLSKVGGLWPSAWKHRVHCHFGFKFHHGRRNLRTASFALTWLLQNQFLTTPKLDERDHSHDFGFGSTILIVAWLLCCMGGKTGVVDLFAIGVGDGQLRFDGGGTTARSRALTNIFQFSAISGDTPEVGSASYTFATIGFAIGSDETFGLTLSMDAWSISSGLLSISYTCGGVQTCVSFVKASTKCACCVRGFYNKSQPFISFVLLWRQSQPSKILGKGEGLPTWLLYSWGGSRVDEMILARVSSGLAG
ncbi:hypothetical protein Tco_1313265 [Tanacetum coccineum]